MKVGIFDSGIGGMSVLHCAKKMMPETEFIYYADEEHVPYGEKRPEEILGFVKEIFEFMIEQEVDAIVIACNTATSVATKEFREQFGLPIVGMEPAVKKAVETYGEEEKRILVAATPVTIAGEKLHALVERVDNEKDVDLIGLPQLVRFAEQGVFEGEEVEAYLRQECGRYGLSKYGTIVLGCTHFNYFKKSFRKVFGEKIHFVDGNEGTIHQLIRLLPELTTASLKSDTTYYFSGKEADSEAKQQMIQRCMDQLERVYSIQ